MNSTLNRIPLVSQKLLTIGQLPSSYLASMTYEEQLLWLCNYLEKTLLPKINELISSFNNITEETLNAINEALTEVDEKLSEVDRILDEKLAEVDAELAAFMSEISDNIQIITQNIINEKIQNGELIVSLGLNYNETTDALTFYISSETSNELQEDLSSLTTPEVGE